MATKFFTNSGDNTLLNKFSGIFEHTRVSEFDALVGFFRSSGYFRIREHLKGVNHIRILVGINVDKYISEAAKQGLEFNFNANVTQEEFIRKLREDIQECAYSKDVEEGILAFISDIVSGKMEVRAHPDKNIHAKIYIFRPEPFNEHSSGSVITGSSNLTMPGLEGNFEFNVELRDFDDVVFATKTFEKLWKEAVPILSSEVAKAKDTTFLTESLTPFEVYIKLLIAYFGSAINYDPESVTDLPPGYKKLRYQIDAVQDGFNKLMKHNGFILADVVGLGKTIIASIIAKKFYFTTGYRTRILVVHPPAMEESWQRTIKDHFEVPNVDLISNGSLHKVKHPENYDLIIVDEAHKFRSDGSKMFNDLQVLCKTPRKRADKTGGKDKKVILITATPLNNRPEDIRNQLYLFQDSKKSTLEVGNLQHFFRERIELYDKLRKSSDTKYIGREVKKIYQEIREKVLEPVIVRRTRTDIRDTPEYWKDLQEQGVTFPNVEPPRKILYQLDFDLEKLYDDTIAFISDTKKGLGYYRYQAIRYLKPEPFEHFRKATGVKVDQAKRISEQLAHIMRVLLAKRIDSSFHAFTRSLQRYQQANKAMLKMLDADRVFIAPSLAVSEFILDDREEELEKLLLQEGMHEKMQVFNADDFNVLFKEGIAADQAILDSLYERWKKVHVDPKYDEFLHRLRTELLDKGINDNRKLVVFSESKETTDYVTKRLREDGFHRVMQVDSSTRNDLQEAIVTNFDANCPKAAQRDDHDIIFTTEVLAEGVNLHRSNIIVNYDIPWNATRLMQRIGRVNRIGTVSETVYIYNFFPTGKTEDQIELSKKAYLKLQAFHHALGEDSQIYSEDEEFGSFGLFEKLPEEERDERLFYLNYLRGLRNEDPELFDRIKNTVPPRARVGRKNLHTHRSTITFVKDGRRDAFYFLDSDMDMMELTFVEAARVFEAKATEKAFPLHELHHDQIGVALGTFRKEQQVLALGEKASAKLGPNEQKALAFINQSRWSENATDDEKQLLDAAKAALRTGRFQKLPRDLNKLLKESQAAPEKRHAHFRKLISILNGYPLLQRALEIEEHLPDEDAEADTETDNAPGRPPRIIISESFI